MQLTHGGRALTEGIVHSSGDHVQRRLSHLGHPASNQSPRPRLNLWETHKCSKHVEGKAKQHVANTGLNVFVFFSNTFFSGVVRRQWATYWILQACGQDCRLIEPVVRTATDQPNLSNCNYASVPWQTLQMPTQCVDTLLSHIGVHSGAGASQA